MRNGKVIVRRLSCKLAIPYMIEGKRLFAPALFAYLVDAREDSGQETMP